VTTKSDNNDYDFYSRCFCPWIGINEDPVTGASHSVLAKYWGDILRKKEMSAFQLSARGGFLKLNLISDKELEVRSNAQIVFEGEMNL
jgi:predicted PhzF superfamily epimerase YddE/YHI9